MPTSELQGFLDDWQARLKVLNGKDFQDAQQWLGEFLSVLADGYRRQTLKNLGLADVTNMSAAQLEDAITRIEADRLRRQQSQVAFDQQRQQTVQTVQARNAATQQTLDRAAPGLRSLAPIKARIARRGGIRRPDPGSSSCSTATAG